MSRNIPAVRAWRYRFWYADGTYTDALVYAPTKFLAILNARAAPWFFEYWTRAKRMTVSRWLDPA